MSASRIAEAAARKLSSQQAAAVAEVERILDAALRVIERASPDPPRIADIVAEAGTSNQTLYGYFAGKHDLILAVVERGVARLTTYLAHQMAKHPDPRAQVRAWIEGAMAQVTNREAATASRAALSERARGFAMPSPDYLDSLAPIRDLLLGPLRAGASVDPVCDAEVIFESTFGALRRHVWNQTAPTPDDIEHLVAFCLRGAGW